MRTLQRLVWREGALHPEVIEIRRLLLMESRFRFKIHSLHMK